MHRLGVVTLLLLSLQCAREKPPEVVPVDREQLQRLIKDRSGNPLFLNVWATWCKPCIEEFPDIVKLAEEYRHNREKIEFIAVSVDYPDQIDSLILPFLKKFPHVPFRVYVADVESQDEFISSLDTNWSGAMPATFLYAANGQQQKLLLGQHSYQQFKEEVEKVLHIR